MVYKVPDSEARNPDNRFEYEIDGKVHSAVLLGYASAETSVRMQELFQLGDEAPARAQFELMTALLSDGDTEVQALLHTLDNRQFEGLIGAYMEASQITPGESLASQGSSSSTAGPSSETSSS